VLTSINRLAEVLGKQGKHEEAEAIARQVLEGRHAPVIFIQNLENQKL
jgi:glutaredoxin